MEEDIENKKILPKKPKCVCKPWLGVSLAVISTAILVGGGIYYLIRKEYTGRVEKIISQLKDEREITKEYETKKKICEKEKEKLKSDLISGKYTSIDNIIEFDYSKNSENPLYEKDGIIQFLWPIKTAQSNPLNFPEYQTISVNEEKYALKTFLESSSEGIMIINKEDRETLEDAIGRLIKKQGKNPNNCKIVKKQDGEKEIAWIELSGEYKPTQEEIANIETPLHKESILVAKKTKELCSVYSPPGTPGFSEFEYNPNINKSKFIFKKLKGLDGAINYYTVNFINQN